LKYDELLQKFRITERCRNVEQNKIVGYVFRIM